VSLGWEILGPLRIKALLVVSFAEGILSFIHTRKLTPTLETERKEREKGRGMKRKSAPLRMISLVIPQGRAEDIWDTIAYPKKAHVPSYPKTGLP
jgi:hypothetical protein